MPRETILQLLSDLQSQKPIISFWNPFKFLELETIFKLVLQASVNAPVCGLLQELTRQLYSCLDGMETSRDLHLS